MAESSAHDFSFSTIDGGPLPLANFRGKPVLLVNTASFCGYTPQYADLERLHQRLAARGLVVLGVPSNDFGAQEPKTEPEIAKFCETSYGVTFPMTSKEKVIGVGAHALYRWVVAQAGEDAAPKWNFHKYLIGKKGELLETFGSRVSPAAPEIKKSVEQALA
jgi:glutathione peroxidase